jgi:hypothetical protein
MANTNDDQKNDFFNINQVISLYKFIDILDGGKYDGKGQFLKVNYFGPVSDIISDANEYERQSFDHNNEYTIDLDKTISSHNEDSLEYTIFFVFKYEGRLLQFLPVSITKFLFYLNQSANVGNLSIDPKTRKDILINPIDENTKLFEVIEVSDASCFKPEIELYENGVIKRMTDLLQQTGLTKDDMRLLHLQTKIKEHTLESENSNDEKEKEKEKEIINYLEELIEIQSQIDSVTKVGCQLGGKRTRRNKKRRTKRKKSTKKKSSRRRRR